MSTEPLEPDPDPPDPEPPEPEPDPPSLLEPPPPTPPPLSIGICVEQPTPMIVIASRKDRMPTVVPRPRHLMKPRRVILMKPMRWLVCAALLALPLVATAETRGVRVLARPQARDRAEAVLVDALRIYMRDLGRPVRLGSPAPASLDTTELERIAADARRDGDEIVVWFGARGGAPVLLALRVPTFELRETAVERDDPSRTARTLALKVRALLSSNAVEPGWSVPPEAPPPTMPPPGSPPTGSPPTGAPPAGTPPTVTPPTSAPPASARPTSPTAPPSTAAAPSTAAPAPTTPATSALPSPPEQGPDLAAAAAPPTPAPAPAPPPATVAAPAAPSVAGAPSSRASTSVRASAPGRPRRVWLDATVAYGVMVPTTTDWVRHGLTVRLAVPWGRLPLATFADTAFTTAPTATVDNTPISARVWPVAAGVVWRLRRPRWQVEVGPRASLQIIDADAQSADGRTGSARRYAAGLGALADASWLFSRYVGAVASVTAEALVPRVAFAAGGPGTTDLGWFQFGVTLGLLVSVP
jgi:hypothetical protein